MKGEAATADDASVFRCLAENNDESAAAAILIHLCRHSRALRHWLWEDFGRNPKVRSKFAQVVKGSSSFRRANFADLTDDAAGLREEQRRLRTAISPALYGGLTWNEIGTLIRQYQAGTVDLGAFLLADAWRQAGKASPLMLWAGAEFLDRVIPSGRRRLLKHLDRALGLIKRTEDLANRRAATGYTDWWKLQALLFILRHPKPSYRTRELRTHLSVLSLQISAKDIRRFCTRHRIRRDMRPGRPRMSRFSAKAP